MLLQHRIISWLAAALLVIGTLKALFAEPQVHRRRSGLERSVVEQATPDCGLPAVPADPARQRLRHLSRLGAAAWQEAGYRGQGIKVAILDTGFRGYAAHRGAALPGRVTVRSFRFDGNLEAKESQHGILCGEVVHALAPDAELLLANWETNRPETFLAAARWARQQGARILTCSVIIPSWSDGAGGGPVHQALREIIGPGDKPGDLLCFASAGNTARRHWAGPFRDDGHGMHEWHPGQTDNLLYPWGNERVSVELTWKPGSAYRLRVLDALTLEEVGEPVGATDPDQGGAVVRFLPEKGRRYRIQVQRVGQLAGPFRLIVLGGDLAYSTPHGSIAFPADGPEVIAVGAVDADGERLPYSCCGLPQGLLKPDFTAPVPFPSLWRSRPFTGTSAAAPQAAGLAALCWSRHPDWTAHRVRRYLQAAAIDLASPGPDCETGHGLIRLPPPHEERWP